MEYNSLIAILIVVISGFFSILNIIITFHYNRKNTNYQIYKERLKIYHSIYQNLNHIESYSELIKYLEILHQDINNESTLFLLIDPITQKNILYIIANKDKINSGFISRLQYKKYIKNFINFFTKEFNTLLDKNGYEIFTTHKLIARTIFYFFIFSILCFLYPPINGYEESTKQFFLSFIIITPIIIYFTYKYWSPTLYIQFKDDIFNKL